MNFEVLDNPAGATHVRYNSTFELTCCSCPVGAGWLVRGDFSPKEVLRFLNLCSQCWRYVRLGARKEDIAYGLDTFDST